MIIVRAPFRISFFGGGTDIPKWYLEEGGQVISTTIDKFCYVTARHQPPFHEHTIKVTYSKIEMVRRPCELNHPLIRAAFETYDVNNIELHYDADLPGNSGLGTSSSFGVSLVVALAALQGKLLSKQEIADAVIQLEREILQEPGGHQDQIAAAFGGFNKIEFHDGGGYSVKRLPLPQHTLEAFRRHLMLFYIPLKRFSGDVSPAATFNKADYEANLRFLAHSVDTAIAHLMAEDFVSLGQLLHEAWLRKRQFKGCTNPTIDDIYEAARGAGAWGGKVLGAGGGGFFLICCDPAHQVNVRNALTPLLYVPFQFEREGVNILYYQQANPLD